MCFDVFYTSFTWILEKMIFLRTKLRIFLLSTRPYSHHSAQTTRRLSVAADRRLSVAAETMTIRGEQVLLEIRRQQAFLKISEEILV